MSRFYYRHRTPATAYTPKGTGVTVRHDTKEPNFVYLCIGQPVRLWLTREQAWALHACLNAALHGQEAMPDWVHTSLQPQSS